MCVCVSMCVRVYVCLRRPLGVLLQPPCRTSEHAATVSPSSSPLSSSLLQPACRRTLPSTHLQPSTHTHTRTHTHTQTHTHIHHRRAAAVGRSAAARPQEERRPPRGGPQGRKERPRECTSPHTGLVLILYWRSCSLVNARKRGRTKVASMHAFILAGSFLSTAAPPSAPHLQMCDSVTATL